MRNLLTEPRLGLETPGEANFVSSKRVGMQTGCGGLHEAARTDLEIRLGKSKRDLYLLLNGGKRRVRQDPQCRVAKEAFLKCGHLVAFRPTIVVQPPVPAFNKNSHTKLEVLDRGEGYQANIVCVSIKRIHGQDNSGARLVEVHKINLSTSGVPAMTSAGHLIPGECPHGRFLKSSCVLLRSVVGIGEKGRRLLLKFL